MKHGVLFLCLVTALTACSHRTSATGSLLPDTLQLREGDVVLRRCTGLISRMVTMSDNGGQFSHTGIVVDSAGIPMVVHAVPSEPDWEGDPDRVKMEPARSFLASDHAVTAAILRPRDTQAGQLAAHYAVRRYREGTLFDHDFDDQDTVRLYCTQLIVLAYEQAGVELVDTTRKTIDLPGFHYRCIMPSQIFQSPHLQTIFMFNS